MVKRVDLIREYQSSQTLGNFEFVEDDIAVEVLQSMEVVWNDNIKGKSCIPSGKYILKPHKSPKYGDCYIIVDLYDNGNTVGYKGSEREYCLVHPANYARQLKGCISLGLSRMDIDGDGKIDITNSKNACNRFYD